MSLTLSIFKVTRRLLQLQNQTTCMVDHPGLEPVFECVLTTECIQHLQGRLWAFTSKRSSTFIFFECMSYQSFLQYKYDWRIKYNKLLFPLNYFANCSSYTCQLLTCYTSNTKSTQIFLYTLLLLERLLERMPQCFLNIVIKCNSWYICNKYKKKYNKN